MGVIKQGILGGFSGRVAGVVGSSWKGIAVIKSLPLSVANPQTAPQMAQRGAMTQVVKVGRLLLASIITSLWNPFAQKMSGFNDFVKNNIKAFTPAGLTTPASFWTQRGSLVGVDTLVVTANSATNLVSAAATNNTGVANALGTDESRFVYYNQTQDYWVVASSTGTRAGLGIAVSDSLVGPGDVIHGYYGFARPNFSIVSDSSYSSAVAS